MKQRILKALNLVAASIWGPLDGASDKMVVLAFHSVLPDLSALNADVIDPYQPLTLADVEEVATALQSRGYRFVTGQDVAAGPDDGPVAWLTFDDGYANNLQLVPLLERLGLPATIFVATANIDLAEAFWWDVLFREGKLRGIAPAEIEKRRETLKTLPPQRIVKELKADFGSAAFRPIGDLDRPMTPAEVCMLAAHPLIEIGNHTHHHTILPKADAFTQAADIKKCQARLSKITGKIPTTIAYPNGHCTQATLDAAKAAGLLVGVTCTPRAFTLSRAAAGSDELMSIGRFSGLRHGVINRELRLATARKAI
jgi:peptidoglycan/xylan/chitin deacetylase (PgdA/CDA1 family)